MSSEYDMSDGEGSGSDFLDSDSDDVMIDSQADGTCVYDVLLAKANLVTRLSPRGRSI